MLIRSRQIRTRLDRLNDLVIRVQNDAMASSVALQLVALKHANVVAAVVTANVHVMDIPGANGAESRPYKVLSKSATARIGFWNTSILQVCRRYKGQPVLLDMER